MVNNTGESRLVARGVPAVQVTVKNAGVLEACTKGVALVADSGMIRVLINRGKKCNQLCGGVLAWFYGLRCHGSGGSMDTGGNDVQVNFSTTFRD
jgi:hypothetical protein